MDTNHMDQWTSLMLVLLHLVYDPPGSPNFNTVYAVNMTLCCSLIPEDTCGKVAV